MRLFQKFIEIFMENLEFQAAMSSENEGTFQSNDVAAEFRIMKQSCL